MRCRRRGVGGCRLGSGRPEIGIGRCRLGPATVKSREWRMAV
jgi:hypothetical protein